LREVESVKSEFAKQKLTIACLSTKKNSRKIEKKLKIKNFFLKTRKLPKSLPFQFLKYLEWHFKIFNEFKKFPLKVIHCHDLAPLLIGVHLKILKKAKLIYDAHELESEIAGNRGLRKWLSKNIEKLLLYFVDYLITVSPSIARWYKKKFPASRIEIIRNIPKIEKNKKKSLPLKRILKIPKGSLLFLYLGALERGRGIENCLKAFNQPEINHQICFLGGGILAKDVERLAQNNPRIHRLEPVPPSEIHSYAAGADIGICLTENTCLNHRFCLPNKLFEYILSGLPVLGSNLPDLKKIIQADNLGWIIEPEAEKIFSFLKTVSSKSFRKKKDAVLSKRRNFSWENESKKLNEIYQKILKQPV
jgi:glycosyltransferase involved in cell wall biosynthesis